MDSVISSVGASSAIAAAVQKSQGYQPTPIETEVISIIKQEKAAWEDAAVFVTDKVSFQMRNLIRLLRKNYWGIFQDPFDPLTGEEKIWVPLTESIVETVIKNIDLDTKDINFIAKNGQTFGIARIARAIVKDALDRMNFEGGSTFGEKLDAAERDLSIDGTKVWITI